MVLEWRATAVPQTRTLPLMALRVWLVKMALLHYLAAAGVTVGMVRREWTGCQAVSHARYLPDVR